MSFIDEVTANIKTPNIITEFKREYSTWLDNVFNIWVENTIACLKQLIISKAQKGSGVFVKGVLGVADLEFNVKKTIMKGIVKYEA